MKVMSRYTVHYGVTMQSMTLTQDKIMLVVQCRISDIQYALKNKSFRHSGGSSQHHAGLLEKAAQGLLQ